MSVANPKRKVETNRRFLERKVRVATLKPQDPRGSMARLLWEADGIELNRLKRG